MSDAFGFGSDRQAAALVEISSVIAGNLKRSLVQHGIDENTGSIPDEVLVSVFRTAYAQNAEIAALFADRFEAEGNSDWAETCKNWSLSYAAQAALLEDETITATDRLLNLAGGAIDSLDGQAHQVAMGAKAENLFRYAGVAGDIQDYVDAWRKGDLSAILAVFASGALTSFLSAMAIGIVAAVGTVSWPLVALVAIGGAFSSEFLEDVTNSAFDAILEDWFNLDTGEDEDIRQAITYLVSETGGAELPALGWFVKLGTDASDSIDGRSDQSNALVGSGGDDVIYGGQLNDHISGGGDADTLHGEGGKDTILGGDGQDVLVGGKSGDNLDGGEGFDTYRFSASDFSEGAEDTILDSDGLGKITFENIAIGDYSVNNVSRDGLGWETHDRVFRLQVVDGGGDQSLMIVHRESGGRIVVKNWSNGNLGITLPGLGQPGTPENPFPQTNGHDLIGRDGDKDAATPVSGDDGISGLAGNDGIDGGYGDDWIDGGTDDDLLFGGPGSNRLIGGLGNDVLISYAAVMDWRRWDDPEAPSHEPLQVIYDRLEGLPDVIMHGNGWYAYAEGGVAQYDNAPYHLQNLQLNAWGPTDGDSATEDIWINLDPNVHKNGDDEIDAGEGSDTAYGGDGGDLISGGSGNDLLVGGRDTDYIAGDDDDDLILGDDMTAGSSIFAFLSTRTASTANASGNDMLTGGLGNDRIYGQGGNDVIDGGVGNDILSGDRMDYGFEYVIDQPVVAGNDHIDGGAGDDQIYGDGGSDTLQGGAGVDLLVGDALLIDGSLHGNDDIRAGSENDTAYGLGGNDTIRGDDGDDLILGDADQSQLALQFHGRDTLYGGAGNDELQGGGGNDLLDGGTEDDLLFGEEGDDRLIGGAGLDVLVGGAGIDSLNGGAGNDELWGEADDDLLRGEAGADTLRGGDGKDTLDGGLDNDNMAGGAGADSLAGGDGQDLLWGEAGDDRIEGGAANDKLFGDEVALASSLHGQDYLAGGDGDDLIHGQGNNDTVLGGAGNDNLFGDDLERQFAGDDLVRGGAGNDFVDGGAGNDTLHGDEGNDTLIGGAGNDRYVLERGFGADHVFGVNNEDAGLDTVHFGAGIQPSELLFGIFGEDLGMQLQGTEDVVWIHGYFGLNAQVGLSFEDGSTVSRQQLEQLLGVGAPVVGTTGDDAIQGTDADDRLYGGLGNDTINGGAGNDYLNGGGGNDTLNGGAGHDVLVAEQGVNTLVGGTDDDTYIYGGGQDTIDNAGGGYDGVFFDGVDQSRLGFTRDGDDLVITVDANPATSIRVVSHFLGGDYSIDYVQPAGGSLLDTAAINALVGSGEGDYPTVIDGTGNGEQLLGTSGRDLLRGLGGDDELFGFSGDDKLEGGDGNDYLSGGNGIDGNTGNDILLGGAGIDTLVGEDGNDQMMGGTGDDNYVYGGGADTIDNTGGGVDCLFFTSSAFSVEASRITFYRSGDDLIVRVDENANTQVTVTNHFLGGDYALAYVQPVDGYAIPLDGLGSLLNDSLSEAFVSVTEVKGGALEATGARAAVPAMRNHRADPLLSGSAASILTAREAGAVDWKLPPVMANDYRSISLTGSSGASIGLGQNLLSAPSTTGTAPETSSRDLQNHWHEDVGHNASQDDVLARAEWQRLMRAERYSWRYQPFDSNGGTTELELLVHAMASFSPSEAISGTQHVGSESIRHQMVMASPL